jgi:serine/threonine protein kinase/tetratricopeptide (TPR) repeat protein
VRDELDLGEGRVLAERYEVLERVGGGAMGSVYRARQLLLDRDVAIKVLRGGQVDSRERRRLHREARAVARIQNPHVVQVHDYGETEQGDPFLVMELVPGPTVAQWVRGGPPALSEAVAAGSAMLAGLAAAHARGVLHRDLKPANMLLRHGDPTQLVLVDFGIAAVFWEGADAEEALTREGTVVGTPLYMSPEQALGEPVGPESDVYAAGVVLYEWLSGRPPFSGPVMDVMRSHAFRTVPPLEPRAGLDPPAAVVDVVMRALTKSRAARFGSAGDMREALLAAAGDTPRASRPAPSLASSPALSLASSPALPEPTVPSPRVAPAPPFVGRSAEMEQLSVLFRQVRQGRGGITFVEGASGVGASRLCAELLARLGEHGSALVGRGSSVSGGAPLAPLRQAVEEVVGSRSLGLDALRSRLEGAVAHATGGSLADEEQAALVRWLRPESFPGTDGDALWSSALVERFLRVMSRARPIVLWLDDFERAGAAGTGWLEAFAAAQRLDPFPMWVLVTRSRTADHSGEVAPVSVSGLRASDVVGHLAVHPLSDPAVVELAQALAPLTRQACEVVAGRAGGLPLVVLHLVRHLTEAGRLVPVGERLGLRDGDDLRGALPGSLRDLWTDRLASAVAATTDPALAALVLDVAAALGPRFAVDSVADGLVAIGAAPTPDAFDGVLDELIAAGVVHEVGAVGGDELLWEHPSLVDVVLQRLGASRRARRRAGQLASAFLAWEQDRSAPLARNIVRLLELSGDTAQLPTPALTAGTQALAADRLGEAERLLALACAPSAPPEVVRAALDARAETARLAGRYADAAAWYTELLASADGLERGRLLVGRGRSHLGRRALREAARDLIAGIGVLAPFLPGVVAARETSRALAALGPVADVLGDVAVPRWDPDGLLASAATPEDRHVIAASLGYLAARDGDLERGIALHEAALTAARAAHHRLGLVVSLYDLGWTERRAGRLDAALTHLSECQRLAAAYGRRPMLARVHNELGELHRGQGAIGAARGHYAEGAELLAHTSGPEAWLCVLNLARLDAEHGRGGPAADRLIRLERMEAVPEWLLGPFSLTLAFCLAGRDDDEARGRMRAGLGALSTSPDARAGAAEILTALADRWEAADEDVAAREARSAAIGLGGAFGEIR